jgi:MoaA/NifB/PqqE/SkfB family radical SAM enzyme
MRKGAVIRNPVLQSPPKITLGITETCPLRCRHCYADCASAPKPGELAAPQWIRLIEQLAERGIIQAYIEGGEPLSKPGFIDILRAATPKMMTLLRTHGWQLTRSVGGQLADAGLGRGLVDLMGADAATHEAATGTPESFMHACNAVGHLVAAGVPTDVLVILTRQTAPQLRAIAHLAYELGAERIGILRLYPLGRARRIWREIALRLDEQMSAIAGIDPPAGLGVMRSWHPNDHNCCWQAAAINAFGRAIGCMYLRDYVDFGDATATPYDEIFQHNPLYRLLRSGDVEEHCGACSSTQDSHGGCRSAAYAWHGRWTAPDPFDVTLNHGIDLTVLPPERARDGRLAH